MAFFNQPNSYNPSSPYGAPQPSAAEPLQFFGSGGPSGSSSNYYGHSNGGGGSMEGGSSTGVGTGGYSGVEGRMSAQGSMLAGEGKWYHAFTTQGFEGEVGLMEELGVNPSHILAKSLTVLNPLAKVDANIMDDADLAGPFVFCFGFALVLLFSGKPQFSYIYGVALLGTSAIYLLLNLMSDAGIDAYRTASVLGYCLLPMVGLSGIGMGLGINHRIIYVLASLSILWCTHSASSIFVAVLRMDHQRLLVAYPIGLLYGCFALLSIFTVTKI